MAREVKIKSISADNMVVKNKGVEFEIREGDVHVGDVLVTKAGLKWCSGKTTAKHAEKVSWDEFIRWAERS